VPPRVSTYFRALFNRTEFSESSSRTTELQVEASAARAFPALLDFVYGEGLVVCNATDAVALRFLSNYLGIRDAFDAVNKWINENVVASCAVAPLLLGEAAVYGDEKLMDAAAKVCSTAVFKIPKLSFKLLPPALFHRVVSLAASSSNDARLSIVVADYLAKRHDVDEAIACLLLACVAPNEIAPLAAETLLKVALRCNLPEAQRRCVEAAATNWDVLLKNSSCRLFQKRERAPTRSDLRSKRKASSATSSTSHTINVALQPIPESVQIDILLDALMRAHRELRRFFPLRGHGVHNDSVPGTYTPAEVNSHLAPLGLEDRTQFPKYAGDSNLENGLFCRSAADHTDYWPIYYYCPSES